MRLRNTSFFILLFAIVFQSCQTAQEESADETKKLPNIIMLIGDDQGYPYFGFMGADYVQTPNMDKLAASGTLFTDGYVSDNHCRPSLQTLMTGLLPIDYYQQNYELFKKDAAEKNIPEDSMMQYRRYFDTRALGLPHFATLPKLLAEKGYLSFQGGKWWEFTYQNGGFTHGMTKGWTREEEEAGNWF